MHVSETVTFKKRCCEELLSTNPSSQIPKEGQMENGYRGIISSRENRKVYTLLKQVKISKCRLDYTNIPHVEFGAKRQGHSAHNGVVLLTSLENCHCY